MEEIALNIRVHGRIAGIGLASGAGRIVTVTHVDGHSYAAIPVGERDGPIADVTLLHGDGQTQGIQFLLASGAVLSVFFSDYDGSIVDGTAGSPTLSVDRIVPSDRFNGTEEPTKD
jgi:hypothetical protein